MSGDNATAVVHVGVTSTLLETTSAATQSIINPTTTQNIVNTTTTSPGFFDQKILSEAWDANKTTVAWLVPVIVVVVGVLVLVALALVYVIRGVELWVLKCCHKVCGCCEAPARRLDNEYTHLTESMHDNDAVDMTDIYVKNVLYILRPGVEAVGFKYVTDVSDVEVINTDALTTDGS